MVVTGQQFELENPCQGKGLKNVCDAFLGLRREKLTVGSELNGLRLIAANSLTHSKEEITSNVTVLRERFGSVKSLLSHKEIIQLTTAAGLNVELYLGLRGCYCNTH